MNRFIADTMALVLRLEKRKMPSKIKKIFEQAEARQVEVFLPPIVFAEIGYLSEKERIDTTLEELKDTSKSIKILMK